MKKTIAILLIAAVLLTSAACSSGPADGGRNKTESQTGTVSADSAPAEISVYELLAPIDGIERTEKTVEQKGGGTPVKKTVYARCKNVSVQITGYYGKDLDYAISDEIGYVETMTDEEHNGVVYKTRYFTESDMQCAAVEYNGNAFVICFWTWGDDPVDYKEFLDGVSFTTAPQEQLDTTMFALSYEAPAEFEKFSWHEDENVGQGVQRRSLYWENHDADGVGSMYSLAFVKNADVNSRLESGLDYTETSVNGHAFLKAYSSHTKGHYYAAQAGKDCYFAEMRWVEDESYPPFAAFLNSLRIAE